MRCDHEHDDGAYVLGALSPAERAAFERHLATCSFCREAVADIAVLPGLLGRLDAADFAKLLDPDLTAAPTQRNRMPDLMSAAQTTRRRERRRGRLRLAGASLAAACLALVMGVGAVFWLDRDASPQPPSPAVAMQPVAGAVPVSAEVRITKTAFGTKVDMVCRYAKATSTSRRGYSFRLVARSSQDEQESIGSWLATPGSEVSMSGMTHFTEGQLSRLELIREDDKALLAYDVR
jgi:anti-sigma-K factor RskA